MNKKLTQLFAVLICLFALNANAQVGIGTNQPDPSAQLEVLSHSKGLLIPRMTDIQRGSISSPANGLLVYQTNNESGFYFYNNGNWQKLASTLDTDGSNDNNGNSLLSGDSNPFGNLGKDGDFYINTITKTLIGPKQYGLWPLGGIKLEAEENSIELSLSLDANQNLSIKNGNSVSLSDLYQSLSINGSVLSISGPRNSHVDLGSITNNKLESIVGGSVLGNKTSQLGIPTALSFKELKESLILDKVNNTSDAEKNVLSASKLTTPRTINGVEFDGTKDIVITVDGTASIEGKAVTSTDGTISIANGNKAALAEMTLGLAENAVTTAKIAAGAISDNKLDKTNIPLSGFGPAKEPISMGGFGITNLSVPLADRDAANKKYVDDKLVGIGTLSLDNNQNLSVNGGNSVSLADLYQNLSLNGTVISLSGPRQSHIDLAGLLGNGGGGSGGMTSIFRDGTLAGNGNTGDPLGIAAQGISANRLKNITTNGLGGQVLTSDGNGGFAWSTVSTGGISPVDATTDSKGIIQLSGDLAGTANAPLVRDGAITSDKIAGGNVTDDKILSLDGAKITGTIAVDKIAGLDVSKIDGLSDSLNEKEDKANKIQDITAATASREKYPSEDAVVKYVADVASTIVAGGAVVATSSTPGIIQLAGDLTGMADAPLVRDGAISASKIADNAITTDKIADASITDDKIAGPLSASKINGVSQDVMDYVDGKIASGGTGGTSALVEATETVLGGIQLAGDLTGTAKVPLVRDGAITSAKITDAAITTDKIADGNVTDDKILSLDGAKITGTIAVDKIAGLDASKINGLSDSLDEKEDKANKIQDITAATASAEKYPSEDAVVKYVADVASTIIAGGGVLATTSDPGTIVLAGDLDGLATAPIVRSGAISSGKLATNAVTTDKILDASVTEVKLAANAVTENKIADNAVTGNKIADHSVTTDKIADASVTDDKIKWPVDASKIAGTNKDTQDKIDDVKEAITELGKNKENAANKSNDGTFAANSAVLFPTQQAVKSYVDSKVGTGVNPATETTPGIIQLAGDLGGNADAPTIKTGAIDAGKLAADAVITAKILDKNVTSQKLADGAVTALQLGKDAVTNDKIAAGVDGSKISDGTISGDKLAPGAITNDKIANLDASKVTGLTALLDDKQDVANISTNISTDAASDIKYPSVKAIKDYVDIKVGSGGAPATETEYGSIKMAGDLIGSLAEAPTIKTAAITATKLASDAVETIKIKDEAVTEAKLADGAVSNDKIAAGIDGGKISDGTITNEKISGAIDASKVDGISQDVSNALALKEDVANKSTDNKKLDFMSNEKFPTELVVKAFVGAEILKAQIAAGGGTGPASETELGTIVLAGDLTGDPYAPTVKGLTDKEPKFDVLPVTKGGTGIATYTPGSFIKAETATKLVEASAAVLKADLGLDKVDNLSGADIDNKIHTALSGKYVAVGEKGANDGVATLGSNGKIPSSQLPNFESGSVDVVADQAAMLALSTNSLKLGSLAIVTGESKTYVLAEGDGSSKSHWVEIVSPGSVRTVNGRTGDVVLTKADFPELANLDNTSDAAKPVSDATQIALDSKQDIANISQNIASEANPTSKYPSVQAVSDYVTTAVQSATNTPDASTTDKGIVRLAGDLGGDADAPQLISVNGMAASAVSSGAKLANDATVTKTANALVKRDGAGNIIGDLLGNATTATSVTGLVEVQHGGTGLPSVATGSFLVGDNTTSLTTKTLAQVKTDLGLNNAELTTNKSQSVTTDAASTDKYPSVKAVKDYVDGKTSTGSADKLTTPREINGVEFDGTKDITIPFSTNIAEGVYTNANISVGANGVITLIENGTGGTTLTPATDQELGGVIVGGGLTVDGAGKISSVTDLVYTADPTKGVVSSTTGTQSPATIPAGSTSDASLMLPADKLKLDKIPEPTTTANLVLTSKADGTAEWKAPVSSGGGGGGPRYYKLDNNKVFVKATGPDDIIYTRDKSKIDIEIPTGVFVHYIRINTTAVEIDNDFKVIINITDKSGNTNNNETDAEIPIISLGNRTSPVASSTSADNILQVGGVGDVSQQILGYSGGKLEMQVFGVANLTGPGFYINIYY